MRRRDDVLVGGFRVFEDEGGRLGEIKGLDLILPVVKLFHNCLFKYSFYSLNMLTITS